jgi:uncharacterized membrane protein YgcG
MLKLRYIVFLLCLLLALPTLAQASEEIRDFNVTLTVQADNSVDVTEHILYDSGGEEKHGIIREIFTRSSQDRQMTISNISVTDGAGQPQLVKTSTYGSYVDLRIGDPQVTFSGSREYIIRYHATRAVGQSETVDEIYWNATGDEWDMPILSASVDVTLPSGTQAEQASCYWGASGSTEQCASEISASGETYHFQTQETLQAGEGLTVALGFPKGVVTPYTEADNMIGEALEETPENKSVTYSFALFFPLLSLLIALPLWYKKGRDERPTGTIVPQYEAPSDLNPLEASLIINEHARDEDISAEIIYLATKGYLKIREIPQEYKESDYELVKLRDFADVTKDSDTSLLEDLFTTKSRSSVKLSELKHHFYTQARKIQRYAADGLLRNNYYKNLSFPKLKLPILFAIFFDLWLSVLATVILSFVIIPLGGDPWPTAAGILMATIIWQIFAYYSPAKTSKGVTAKEYLLGLRDYLQIAEKDRLIFHNAPEKKPEIFEKLLPYAMVLGVAKIWAKEFADIYLNPPEWYEGRGGPFNAVVFSNNLSHFARAGAASMAFQRSSHSMGSGGGGFSGGGGGGGGGGSW